MNFTARKWLAILTMLAAISGLGLWGMLSFSASGEALASECGMRNAECRLAGYENPQSAIRNPQSQAPMLIDTATPTCVPAGTPGPWSVVSPLPLAARNFGMDTDGTYAYAAGGSNVSIGALNRFSRYDPATNTWTMLTPMPVPAIGPSLVYAPINNKIYVFGGSSSDRVFVNTQVYDIATGTWSDGADMPGYRWMMAAGYYDGKIYLASGSNSPSFTGIQTQLWEYDPLNDTWDTSRAAMPSGRLGPGYGIVNGHMYVMGGMDTNGNSTNSDYDYDIVADTWTVGANMPTGVYAPASAVSYGRVLLLGGGVPFQSPDVVNLTQIYNPTSNTWSSGPHLNQSRNLAGGTVVGNHVIVSGGLGTTAGNDTNITEVSNQPPGTCPTSTPPATSTPGPSRTPTNTRTATATTVPTNTRTPQPSPTESLPFSDVQPGDYFYQAVRYLYFAGDITGYGDGTFRPYNNTTRGQLCKIVVLAKNWDINTDGGPHFSDVDPSHTFYDFVETAYNQQIISGYSDGTFRPDNNVARAQLSKIITLAIGWAINCPDVADFSDVPPSDAFYCFVETAYQHGIISGYSDGTFHPYANATRGQICAIIYRAITGAAYFNGDNAVSVLDFNQLKGNFGIAGSPPLCPTKP